MYNLKMPIFDKTDKEVPVVKSLLKEVLGYTDEEVHQFEKNMFMTRVAENLTLEQLKVIIKPFYDNGIHTCITDCKGNHLSHPQVGINLTKEPPKDHYYDHPVVSRDQLVDPFTQKEKERQENYARQEREERIAKTTQYQPKCPTCGSPNVEKIGFGEKLESGVLWGLFSPKIHKSYKCKNCKYMW